MVQTQTERLARIRRGVMELYASDHPDGGLTDPASALSEMPKVAAAVGLTEVRYAPGANHVAAECFDASNPLHIVMDGSNPYFSYDPAKCIVCYRCVRACEEVQGTYALTVEGRGFESRIVAGMAEEFVASECVSCGACVQACPTGSLVEKAIAEIGTPEHSKITTCAYCGVGLRLQGGDARRAGGADGAVEGRQGQPRAFLRQGALCLRLCDASRADPRADGAREDHRPVARDDVGGGDRAGRSRVPADPGRARARVRWAASPRRAAPTRTCSWCRS